MESVSCRTCTGKFSCCLLASADFKAPHSSIAPLLCKLDTLNVRVKCQHTPDPKGAQPWGLWPKQTHLRWNMSARRTLVTEPPRCWQWQECCPSFSHFPLFACCKCNINSELIFPCSLQPRSSVTFLSSSKLLIGIYNLPFPLIRFFFFFAWELCCDERQSTWGGSVQRVHCTAICTVNLLLWAVLIFCIYPTKP